MAWTETGDCGEADEELAITEKPEPGDGTCSSRAPGEQCQYRDYVGNDFLRFQMDGTTRPLESVERMAGDNFS